MSVISGAAGRGTQAPRNFLPGMRCPEPEPPTAVSRLLHRHVMPKTAANSRPTRRNREMKYPQPAGIQHPQPPRGAAAGGEFLGSPPHQGTSPPVRRRIPGRLQSRFHNLGDFGILPRRPPFPSPAGSDELTGTAPPSSGHSGEQTRGLRGPSSLIPYLVPFPIKFAAPELLPSGQKPSRSLPVEQASCFLRQYPHGMRAPSHGLSAN